ncbi:MAG: hypothetical protein HYW88_02830 [Candidatus Sungbacteria bacterium]|nr:hypothetical protein [Candidatus Sungbacteria bacterium]
MKEDNFEENSEMREATKESVGHQRYVALGGIINEVDYTDALSRIKSPFMPSKAEIQEAENIGKFAGIELHNTKNVVDKTTMLYAVLRNDSKPEGVTYHHSQMSDQRLFAETLRMLGDADSLKKLISAYPNISF